MKHKVRLEIQENTFKLTLNVPLVINSRHFEKLNASEIN